MPQIYFNGKTYNDIAEMPAMERQAYEQLMSIFKDEDQDGVPDIFQGDIIGNIIEAATTTVVVDGKPVSGLGEMTPQKREKVEQILTRLQRKGIISQVPDLSKRDQGPTWEDAEIHPSKPIIPSPSAIQDDRGSSRWLVTFLVLFGLLACGIGAAVFFYLSQGL